MNNSYDLVATDTEDGDSKRLYESEKREIETGNVLDRESSLQLLVEPNEEARSFDERLGEERSLSRTSSIIHLSHKTLLPDEEIYCRRMRLVEGPAVIKFLKFLVVSSAFVVILFHLIRSMDWEHNENLRLSDLYTYESSFMIQDALVFFVVGRLYKQRGIDHMAWIGWCFVSCLFSSVITRFRFLQHAFTLYEIHCRWPWQLWVYIILFAPIVVGLVLMHVHAAVQTRIFLVKLGELLLCILLFLVPYLHSEFLHMHHWYMGWLLGMHSNIDLWWSRAGMAWCWGLYLNGISAYGRDPVLTCGYSYWLSEHMRCPYMRCYQEELEHPTPKNASHHVEPMVLPDWRNCSADSYHP